MLLKSFHLSLFFVCMLVPWAFAVLPANITFTLVLVAMLMKMMMMMMMMMMSYFLGIVDRRKTFSLISSQDHF